MKRVKPFDDLMYFPTTLGMEASPDSRRTKLDPEGLCVSHPKNSKGRLDWLTI
jgi:hypothetical protein